MKSVVMLKTGVAVLCASLALAADTTGRWSAEKANAWQKRTGWLVGCNYLPATAINQLEMWQADTFDAAKIDKELGWAESLGFNSLRVFLHHLLWEQDAKGFLERMDRFLAIADKHKIGVMFVLFDSCWDPFPKLGKQRAPRKGVHNSGWVQSPGADDLQNVARHRLLESYVKGVVGRFRNDRRIHAWDVWNEPDNMNPTSYGRLEPRNKQALVAALLPKAFAWARLSQPCQPLTSGLWMVPKMDAAKLSEIERLQLAQSDVLSFHNYEGLVAAQKWIEYLRPHHRPILCTEYIKRPECRFDPILGYFKQQKVGAYNWGLVGGKSQTMFSTKTWLKPETTEEPKLWSHDILRRDGTPFDPAEAAYIRQLTGKAPSAAVSTKPTLADVPYGEHERQVLDFYKAESDKPTPVLFYIHGGGWVRGDKNSVGSMLSLLKEGISVVSINYRYVQQAQLAGVKPPVAWPLHDAARALQFVRSKAKEWNIDKRRIAASGGSAGACSSLWLAFHDEMADPKSSDPVARESTRLWCAAVNGAQTSLDPQQLVEWTPNSRYGGHAFGFMDPNDLSTRDKRFAEFLAARTQILPWIKEYSPIEHVTAGDPPVYLLYNAPPALGQDQKDPTHTANYGVKLQEKCRRVGVECELVYPGAPDVKHATVQAFLVEKLKSPPR